MWFAELFFSISLFKVLTAFVLGPGPFLFFPRLGKFLYINTPSPPADLFSFSSCLGSSDITKSPFLSTDTFSAQFWINQVIRSLSFITSPFNMLISNAFFCKSI